MLTISQDKAYERWDTLPDVLCDALFSEPNSDFIWKISEAEHIPSEKIYDVARISGYVLMGFLHPEDVAEELQEAIGIDPKTANSIERELNKRIFEPLKPQIDQVYSPPSKYGPTPKTMQEATATISSTPQPPLPPSAPAPKIISETFSAAAKFGAAPLASKRNIAGPAPKPSNGVGWSKATPQQPVVKLGAITPGVPSPSTSTSTSQRTISMPTAPAKSAGQTGQTSSTASASIPVPTPAQPARRTMSEFERIDLAKKTTGGGTNIAPKPSTPVPSPSIPRPRQATPRPPQPTAQPSTPPQPAPMMLHEVSSAAPLQNTSFNTRQPAQDQLKGSTLQGPTPPKPAVVEFSGSPAASSTGTKAVHYTAYNPALPRPAPAADAGPRNITEIQAPIQKPASGQTPSSSPTTPQPPVPADNKDKVIVKDFL